ncbi:PREDICTED: uncharacterized protein LOC108765069 [Trachymyrmex cornetzi]|uniref:uncharacterized protein LOC108765069 n=1 Tax=Trachymyrmex cornetzi TaxID=471704 RepID=UPI00084ED88C|nr:PREDICTED: uncharacterized protein LOC108765069 [Trachymyrmex cornetzi]
MASLAQINVNRSRPSQDLVSKISEKLSLGLVAISEPNCVPDNDRWLASNDSPPSAAITWQWSQSRVPCSPRWRGTRFVAMDWGEMIVVSCYFPPSLSDGKFSRDLYELENKLLGIVNEGPRPTCVHPRDVSCVDLTLASPSAARRIISWRVESGLESLSDHRYVITEVGAFLTGPAVGKTALKAFPRWVVGRVDPDLMEAAAVLSAWSGSLEESTKRPLTYWWNQEIAGLRRNCNTCRRRLTRAHARRETLPAEIQGLWDELREARRRLRKAIIRSKAKLWGELVDDLDRDPWGILYRVALKKLHSGGASLVEVLPTETAGDIVVALFPMDPTPQDIGISFTWREDLVVTPAEILEAGAKVKSGKAPGPDRITGCITKIRRLQAFLDEFEGIAEGQYGFRCHRSIIAVWSLRERVGEGLRDGGVAVAVSLDIENAFNSLPWSVIRSALEEKDIPGASSASFAIICRIEVCPMWTGGTVWMLGPLLCGRYAHGRLCRDLREGARQS